MVALSNVIDYYKASFPFYAEECLRIKTKDGSLKPFVLNRAQKYVWSLIESDLRRGKPIRYIVLKGRQQGMSTLFEGLGFWFVTLNSNRNARIVAQDNESVRKLFDKEQVFFSNLPNELKPITKAANKNEIHFANPDPYGISGLESHIGVYTAESENLGRSVTIHFVHLSEFAFWDGLGYDPTVRMLSINQSLPELPGTFLFIESTANGASYFKTLWDEPEGEYNNFKKVFISWVADESYRIDLAPFQHFTLDNNPDAEFGDEQSEFSYILDEVRKWYPELKEDEVYNETFNRLAWRRFYIKAKCNGSVVNFQQEYPTIPEQAFMISGTNFFDLRQLSVLEKNRVEPNIYAFNDEVDDQLKNINKGNKNLVAKVCTKSFELSQSSYGLRVYEKPRPGFKYVIGADTSEGIRGRDYSACTVLRCPELVEVATFNQIIDPYEYALILFCLGYNYNRALIGVEDNDKGSTTVLNRLSRELFYPNLYVREVFDVRENFKQEQRYGWRTTTKTKSKLIGDLQPIIKDLDIKLNDFETIKQLMLFCKLEDGKTGVPLPGHDDLAIAIMIAYQMSKNVYIDKVVEKQENKKGSFKFEITKRFGLING